MDAILLNGGTNQIDNGTYLGVDLYIIPDWESAKESKYCSKKRLIKIDRLYILQQEISGHE